MLGTRKVYGRNPIFEPPWVKEIGSNSLPATVNILKIKGTMFVDWRREVTFGCGFIGNFEKPRFQEIGLYCSFKRITWCCCGRPGKN